MGEYEDSTNKFVCGTLDYMIKKGEETGNVHNMEELRIKLKEFKDHALEVYKDDPEQCKFYNTIYTKALEMTKKYTYKQLKEVVSARLENSPFTDN